jgi:hypothetical protein
MLNKDKMISGYTHCQTFILNAAQYIIAVMLSNFKSFKAISRNAEETSVRSKLIEKICVATVLQIFENSAIERRTRIKFSRE